LKLDAIVFSLVTVTVNTLVLSVVVGRPRQGGGEFLALSDVRAQIVHTS
jgi:hypothetical protein